MESAVEGQEPRMNHAVAPAERWAFLGCAGAVAYAGLLHSVGAGAVPVFIMTAVGLGGIAYVMGEATSQLGNHVRPEALGHLSNRLAVLDG